MLEKLKFKSLPLLVTFAVGALIWFGPRPEGISPQGWHMLAVFVSTILGIVLKAMPMGALSILAIGIVSTTGTVELTKALSGFSAKAIWLAVAAFFIARGFIKTHLGTRIAYYFIALLGKHSLSLGYSFAVTDLVLSPAIPSTTARSGGIIFPIVNSLSRALGSHPNDPSMQKIGSFLTLVAFQANVITMGMFLTAMVGNPMVAQFLGAVGIEMSWWLWAKAAIVPGLISLAIIPLIVYKVCPPGIKAVSDAKEFAHERLRELGGIKKSEVIMLGVFVVLVVLWVFGDKLHLDVTAVAIMGLAALLLTNVLTWEDVLHERGAWDTLIWFGTLVTLAEQLSQLGVIGYFSSWFSAQLGGFSPLVAFVMLAGVYFYSHYFFASNTAHISAMLPPFLAIGMQLASVEGSPISPMLVALVLMFFSNLFGGLTHYATAPASVLFGSGFVTIKDWWKVGFIVSMINIAIWISVGMFWWRFLGLIHF